MRDTVPPQQITYVYQIKYYLMIMILSLSHLDVAELIFDFGWFLGVFYIDVQMVQEIRTHGLQMGISQFNTDNNQPFIEK